MEFANFIATLLPLISVAVYATIGYLANKTGEWAETSFQPLKVITVFLIAIALSLINYYQGVMITTDQLIALIPTYLGLFYGADKTIKTVVNAKNCVSGTCGIGATGSGTTPTSSTTEWDGTLGLTILPTQQEGTSPFNATIEIRAGPTEGEFAANEATIDWGDGSLRTNVPLYYGGAESTHTFTYAKPPDGKYWSRTFTVTVEVRNSQGKTKEASVKVYCYDPAYTGPK